MGMFNYVTVDESLMPKKYRACLGWQTKDVIENMLETLEIKENGELWHHWVSHRWVEDKDEKFFGGHMEPIESHSERLLYHGDMIFHTGSEENPNDKAWFLIELRARFSNGELDNILDVTEKQNPRISKGKVNG